LRKFPGYDEDIISLWFDRMNRIAPGLVSPFEASFRGLTYPDFIPVANLFDALVRYASLDRIKQFKAEEVQSLPDSVVVKLAMITVKNGETYFENRGKIQTHFLAFDTLTSSMDEENHLHFPLVSAYNRFISVAAYVGLYHPRGQKILQALSYADSLADEEEQEEHKQAPPSLRRKAPHLRLVASNGEDIA